jgi:hypothetical protein
LVAAGCALLRQWNELRFPRHQREAPGLPIGLWLVHESKAVSSILFLIVLLFFTGYYFPLQQAAVRTDSIV